MTAGIILNESAVKLAGLKDPVGQMVKWEPGWREATDFKIIGVVRDMVKGSPFEPAHPSVIFLGNGNWLFIRINQNAAIDLKNTRQLELQSGMQQSQVRQN